MDSFADNDRKYTYSGDTVSPRLQKSIINIIKNEGYLNCIIDVKKMAGDGKSFMGILHEINVVGDTPKGKKEMDLFVKCIIPNEQLSIFSVPRAFEKEAFSYNELFNIFTELQDEYKVPDNERYKSAKGYNECNSEYIIMENLSKKDFTTINRANIVPYDFAAKSMEQLAKFHALSFVIQEKRPKYFEEKIKTFEPSFYYGTEAWNGFIQNMSSVCGQYLDPKAKEKIEKYIPTTYEKYAYYAGDPKSVRCLCHGDYRMNNVMVTYKDGQISELIPVDYQLIFYGCPIIDFLYFIFMNSDQNFRKDHLEDLKEVYHKAMADFLKRFNMDIEDYYPRREFERVYRDRLDYGLMTALWVIPTTLSDVDDIPDYTKTNLVDFKLNVNNTVRSRVQGIVEDFIKWGYL